MKSPTPLRNFFTAILAVVLAALALRPASAVDVAEGTDFPGAGGGPVTVLTLGTNTFSGTLTTPGDQQDRFTVTVPTGKRLKLATKFFAPGGNPSVQSPNCNFNGEDLSGTGSGTFVNNFPLSAGDYPALVSAGLSVGNAWSMSFVLEPEPDYSVTSAFGSLTISDLSGNSDTLSVTNPAAGSIKFAAAGRTFSVNGGPLLTNDSGNISLSGINFITIYPGGGNNTENISAFSGTSFPDLQIYGGTNTDTVNFNGDITFASGNSLYVSLENDAGASSVNLAANANLVVTGTAAIGIYCRRNLQLNAGSSLEVLDGDLVVEANQQASPMSGNFIGVNLDGATIKSTGTGYLTISGRGGDGAGSASGYQFGVQVANGAKVIGGPSGQVTVIGTGGASSNIVNRGVSVEGVNAAITSSGGPVFVTGNAGPVGTGFGVGVSVLNGGEISAGGTGSVTISGTGAGSGGGENRGLELGGGGARITSGGGSIGITGVGGPGGSYGLVFADDGSVTTPAGGGNIVFHSDTVAIIGNASIATTNPASIVQFIPSTSSTSITLGGADDAGAPATLGLMDAELDRVQTARLVIGGNSGSGYLSFSAPISHPTATNITLLPGSGGIFPNLVGTNVALNGTVAIPFGSLKYLVTGTNVTDYSRFKVAGGVNLTGASFALFPLYVAQVGDAFTIVDNDGADPIIGTFTGLPEGAYLPFPGSPALNARISYVGGDGNDVVVTLVSALVVRNTSTGTNIGSLRSALAAAAAVAGPNTITFDPSLNAQAIVLTNQVEISDADGVTIDGTAMTSGFGFSGSGVSRIFQNLPGSTVALKGFGFIGGAGTGTNGYDNTGGAIVNNGTMSISRCTFFNNAVLIAGGAIFNDGTLAMTNCTLSGNFAPTIGGAIFNDGTLALTHCTLSLNSASSRGGGIYNNPGRSVSLANCIVSGNSGSPGADINNSGTVNLSGANFLAGFAGTAPTGPAANTNAPLLATLGGYGGNTTTMALLRGSPARDAAVGSSATNDQRGFPIVGIPDIGAYEAGTFFKYDVWAIETMPTNYTAGDRLRTADPDGDGRINAVEYAIQSSPFVSDVGSALIFTLNSAGTRGTNTFAYQARATDLFYQLDRSTHLPAGWTNLFDFRPATGVANTYVSGVTATTDGTFMSITDTNISGWPQAFYRLRVTLTP